MKKLILMILFLLTISINYSTSGNNTYISSYYSNLNFQKNYFNIKFRYKFNELPEISALKESAITSFGFGNIMGINSFTYNINLFNQRDKLIFKNSSDVIIFWDNIMLTLLDIKNDYIFEKEYDWYGLGYNFSLISETITKENLSICINFNMSTNQNSKILNDLDDQYLKNEMCLFSSLSLRYRYLNNKLIEKSDYRFENILYFNHYKKSYQQFEIRNSMYLKHKNGIFFQADYSHLIIKDYHKDFFRFSLGYSYSFK